MRQRGDRLIQRSERARNHEAQWIDGYDRKQKLLPTPGRGDGLRCEPKIDACSDLVLIPFFQKVRHTADKRFACARFRPSLEISFRVEAHDGGVFAGSWMRTKNLPAQVARRVADR